MSSDVVTSSLMSTNGKQFWLTLGNKARNKVGKFAFQQVSH